MRKGLFAVMAVICMMSLSLILVASIDNREDDDSVSLIESFDNNHISEKRPKISALRDHFELDD